MGFECVGFGRTDNVNEIVARYTRVSSVVPVGAQAEGISCSAMKVVMLLPLPGAAIEEFFADANAVLIPELNYEGKFANLVATAVSRPFTRLNRVPGVPMRTADILGEIRRLAERTESHPAV